MKTGFIMCGALGHEVVDMIDKYQWDAEILGVSAMDHIFPERIAPDVEARIRSYREQYDRLIVIFGDCGSRGALDHLLSHYEDIERVEGPHCYEMYGGKLFHELMEEEPATFFLTDFLVRGFRGTILKGLGLDRFPQLKADYFKNYQRIVYFTQNETPELMAQAQAVADYLDLPLDVRQTGYGLLEERLVALMAKTPMAKSDARAPSPDEAPIFAPPPKPRWQERSKPPSTRRRTRKFRRS